MSDSIVITKVVNRVLVSSPGPQGASGGGGATDGNKGDITVSGSGTSWQINAGAVGSAELAANAVTYDKIQATVAARRLLGRPEATAGNVSEISVGNGLKFDGTSLVVATTDVVSTGTQIIAGTGLTGGTQTLAANVNIGVDFAASGAATAGKAVQATDSRLSDPRTPTTHKTSHATGGTDAIAPADIGAVATTRSVSTGTGLTGGGTLAADRTLAVDFAASGAATAGKAVEATDSRLSNARTPTSHTHAAADITSGTIATARLGSGTASNATFLRGDQTWATVSGGGVADADYGDITVSGTGAVWTIDAGVVGTSKLGGDITTAGKAILDDADASAQRTTLGLGNSATLNTGTTAGTVATGDHAHAASAITSGTLAAARLGSGTADSTTYLRGDGTWATVSSTGGGTKTFAAFTPLDAQPPASNFATLDTRNDIAVLEFDGAATDESTTFVGIMPEAASLGSGLKVRIHWMADTATSGNVRWGVQFQRLTDDTDMAAYDAAQEGNSAAPTGTGAQGTPTVLELTITTIDSIAAGDAFRLKVYREASDTGNDTMDGDAQLIAVEVRSAA